ncbi:hypothetical protein C1646_785843 [Rhizophagus diaphanus]|nr:hypothetical protein C1646_785843 [Rhizophagus diaphanus] [Rhizophagus sp. MUCL 43196]
MLGCIILGEENAFPVDFDKNKTIGHLKEAIKDQAGLAEPARKLILWHVNIPENKKYEIYEGINIEEKFGGKILVSDLKTIGQEFNKQPPSEHIHIIVELPATTGKCLPMVYLSNKKFALSHIFFIRLGTLSIPIKRQAEPQVYNREPVPPHERDFWNELPKAQIVLKLPDDADKTIYMSEPLSRYMKVEGNEIVLNDNVMLNSQDELIFCDSSSVIESEKIIMGFVKFLHLRKSLNGIVYGIPNQDILIKKSYLQMIEKIELDRARKAKGCMIIGSPGIGKTHFSLYFAFYITRRYNSNDIMYEQKFQVVTTPKRDLWHDLVKVHPKKYYAPVWSEEEIWSVWNHQYKDKIVETRIEELIKKWGCIPRRVFVEYENEPDLTYLVSKVDVYKFLKNDGGDLDDDYTGKIIHIIPNADFTNKKYTPGSAEICKEP